MANPQAENGHVDISNEVMDALIAYRISGEEMQCLLFIIRKTWGWKKKEDRIALSQFVKATGINRQSCHRAIKRLTSKNIINVIKKDYENINSYSFIKDFEKWKVSSKKITLSSKKIKEVSSKKMTTKETITKETYSQDFLSFYNFYPIRVKKMETWKSWQKIKKLNNFPPIEVIIETLKKQKASHDWTKDGGKYIPHPTTWLNQGRWDDEVSGGDTPW